jgi:hypothetical protein
LPNKELNILSFGGGIQTVALAMMCINGDYPMPDHLIFADTGWEVEGTYEYLSWFIPIMESAGMKVHVVKHGNLREDALDNSKRFAAMPLFTENNEAGPSYGMLRRQCTNEYKVQPVYQQIREILGLKPYERHDTHVKLWLGISMDETTRMKPNRVKWIENMWPLIEANKNRHQCIEYIKAAGYPLPPKSACIGCPYHSDIFWKNLKNNEPAEFADAVDFDIEIRKHRVSLKNKVFLHRSLRPLGEIDFDNQPDLFDDECEGYCGL